MKTALKIIAITVGILIICGIVYQVSTRKNRASQDQNVVLNDVRGCYVATLGKDVYTLTIGSQTGKSFGGTLSFKNYEKDSSSGDYVGTYNDGILLGDYSFNSEGMTSLMQVIFKKSGNDFVRGYGDVDETGTRFTNLSTIEYDTQAIFKFTPEGCSVVKR